MYLRVNKITKLYGSKSVLNDISFALNPEDSLGIIGQSGCGKSTLIKIIAGLLDQTTGTVSMYSNDTSEYKPNIGYAFQLNALFDSYTIWQNIAFKEYIENSVPRRHLFRRVIAVMEMVNLGYKVAKLYPKDLSGGMQKRVAIARAIFNNPDLLFLDEPTSGLDPFTASKIIKTINDIQVNGVQPIKLSIIHDMKVVKELTNKVLFINNGGVGWFGNSNEIELAAATNEDLGKFISHI
jgi:phospholipid/cholesterol/gamma-HCH transport system ATP-binding protein